MVIFYHNKGIDLLKLGCIFTNHGNICPPKLTTAILYLFTECEKDLLEELCEDMFIEPSFVFTRKAVVDEAFFGIRQTGAHPLLKLLLVSRILSLCVEQCQLVSTRVGNWICKLAI